MPDAFFGLQVALAGVPAARRDRLAAVIRQHRQAEDLIAQRRCWTQASDLLVDEVDRITLGSWDLLRSGGPAEYEDWASGVEAMASWPRSDFGSGGDLLLVTAIVLVVGDSNADRTLGQVCDLTESAWQRRATYRTLLAALPMLNQTNVRGSALYLAPGPELPGFSDAVLTGEGFEYLTRIRD